MSEAISKTAARAAATLKLQFLSHGTLESKDLDFTRKFYEEFLGLEVVRSSKVSAFGAGWGGQHTFMSRVQVPEGRRPPCRFSTITASMWETRTREVDECHRLTVRDAELWKLHKISKPMVQHGTYSFYFWDADDNSWEILANPPGGYTWMFERGDQEGVGPLHEPKIRATRIHVAKIGKDR